MQLKCYSMYVMSLPAMSLGDWFSVSRKGGTGEVGWFMHTHKGCKQCLGLAVKIPQ